MNCLTKNRKSVATALLTIFYCQTVLAAYESWAASIWQPLPISVAAPMPVFKNENLSVKDRFGPCTIAAGTDKPGSYENTWNKQDLAADIGGPTQPEMTSFKSVNSDNMVDLFSGDFSYNIPLLDVGGYPINLFYKSGITMDQEASWVGLGWNINPGTITRNLRGIPDDFDGRNDKIEKSTYVKENKTIGGDIGADVEFFGLPVNVGVNLGVFYNNYRGWGLQNGLHASISSGSASMGSLSAGLSITNNSQEGLSISPSFSAGLSKRFVEDNSYSGSVSVGGGFSYNSRSGLVANLSTGINLSHQQTDKKNPDNEDDKKNPDNKDIVGRSSLYSSGISFASPSYNPTVDIPFTNSQFTFTGKIGGELWGAHPSLYLKGYVSKQYIDDQDVDRTFPAYGYLFYQDANDNPQALLDFNREKDIVYRDKPAVPNIAVPSYTYDLFCITGEGTGGMFRAYRGDIGFVHDPYVATKNASNSTSADYGFGNLFHAGVDININHASTTTGSWEENNPLANTVKFKHSDSVFEAAYFRNPGEKSINPAGFYKSVGDDDVVTAQLYQVSNGPSISSTNYLQHWKNKTATNVSTLLNSSNDFKTKRDKRTQVISYLSASEAARAGLDTVIYNYGLNQWGPAGCNDNVVKKESRVNDFRQPNHISEIDVLNNDGRRYVYGLPVYNTRHTEVTFAVESAEGNKKTGLVKFAGNDASEHNNNGKDHYYQKQNTSPYAHSFLLTSILSSDYVDVTGNGISEDDLGDAIRFNYSKLAGKDSAFKWRTPYVRDSATYNEGLQTYTRDDKGSYIYGEKEVWYLNSVESKNMIAVFMLEKRSDLKSMDSLGHLSNDTTKSKCLRQINLYSKSDYIQNGLSAKPIKTVHFDYSYELCKGINGNLSEGKLTLKKLWFTYNGNKKGTKNPYLFFYNNNNPNYTNTAYDKWGNYKDPLQNPRSSQSHLITNAEFPYALQDSVSANSNAAAWAMDSIILPSSGSIKVAYESDDYAYVQNRRAMQMFNVIGLSHETPATANISNALYGLQSIPENPDNLFVSIRVTTAVNSRRDMYLKYLNGLNKLYFKLNVQMPTDRWGSGYEYIPVYADLDVNSIADSSNYGILPGYNDVIWVKLKGINISGDGNGSYSPLAKAAIQFLRLNLPSKAYPGYETGDELDLRGAVEIITALGTNIINTFSNFDLQARALGWAVRIDTSRTIVRLNNPIYKKYGGGHRVKSIKIYDNWNKMTGAMNQAVYGQFYDYTTIKNINGIDSKISSGVASWEPMMGGEENPFRLPLEYIDKAALLAPVTMGYTEIPLGESFFPAPSVGYSQVRVRSIHSKNIKSATGYQETKFYTAYDFPVITDNSLFTPDTKKRYKTSLSNFLRIKSYHYLSMSQGFKIELNDMNGKIKSQASYAETDSVHPIASSMYYYHVDEQNAEFKHLNNTVRAVNQSGEIDSAATIGKDIELMMDMREQRSLTEGANYGVNVDVFIITIFPIPIPSYIPMPQKEETRFRSVAATKVIQRFGILDSVVAIDKGSKVSTDNLLYDSETGDVLLTRTRNEFNDTIYNFTYPAHWVYSGMGLAYQNINAGYKGVRILNGLLQPNSKYPGMISRFESGDEIMAIGKLKTGENVSQDCAGQSSCPTPIFSSTFDTTRIWAIDSKKIDSSGSLGVVFVDRNGNQYSADHVDLKVIRSGHRNLNASVGTITSLKTPVKKINGFYKLVIDSLNNIISSNAQVFKDSWKTENSFRKIDSCVHQTVWDTKNLVPQNIITLRYVRNESDDITINASNYYNNSRLVTGYYFRDKQDLFGCNTQKKAVRTVFNFDFNQLPANAVVDQATFHLIAGAPRNTDINGDLVSERWDNLNYAHDYNYEAGNNGSEIHLYTTDVTGNISPYDVQYDNSDSASLVIAGTPQQSCNSFSPSMTKLVRRYLNNRSSYYGFILKDVNDNQNFGNCDLGHRFMSFCAANDNQSPNSCITCSQSSYLYLSYHYDSVICIPLCKSAITQLPLNPYVQGILGNWRGSKSFVYYGQRRESLTNNVTNIRSNGVIQNFVPYWSFSSSYLNASTDTTVYVWNAESTLFNRKGFEIENKDPLGRYNAGAYGYNESLPVGVVQNSRYKDQLFDGLEDYGYSTQNCSQVCPTPRNIDFTADSAGLNNSVTHTGKFSLKVNGLDSSAQTFPVISTHSESQQITLLRDSSGIDTLVVPQGNGLVIANGINNHKIQYSGYVQAEFSGYYTVKSSIAHTNYPSAPMGYTLSINNVSNSVNDNITQDVYITVFLLAGEKYYMYVACHSGSYFLDEATLSLEWQRLGSCGTGINTIPVVNLYQSNTPDNSVSYGPPSCKSFKGIITDSSSLLPSFQPSQGQRMVFSAWVKEQKDCLCDQYDSNAVNLSFARLNQPDVMLSFKPAGNIIEGWQRYEAVFNIPVDALSMRVSLKSTGNAAVYFDDIRMHPYNANMKSFVYDPVSLRLMAELDENNYATFYEYDDDGTLIRIKKETEKGVQTIKETRSSLSRLNDQ